MFSLLFQFILVPLVLLVFWFPFVVSIVLIVLFFLIEVSGIAPTLFKVKPSKELKLTPDEEKIFSEYYVFFRYRLGAQDISRMFAIMQVATVLFVPLFLYKGLYIPAGVFAVNYIVLAWFAPKLNPVHYLGDAIKRGKLTYMKEYKLIGSVSEKIANHLSGKEETTSERSKAE